MCLDDACLHHGGYQRDVSTLSYLPLIVILINPHFSIGLQDLTRADWQMHMHYVERAQSSRVGNVELRIGNLEPGIGSLKLGMWNREPGIGNLKWGI